jgi:hypothetical protein
MEREEEGRKDIRQMLLISVMTYPDYFYEEWQLQHPSYYLFKINIT